MTVPSRVRIPGMATAVQINLMEAGAFVVGQVNQVVLTLDELPQWAVAQRAGWQAMRLRAIPIVAFNALLGDRDGRRQPFGLTWIHRRGAPPDAREIGFAVKGARRRASWRLVPLQVGELVRAIFAQRVELRGVAQANVERQCLGRLDGDTFLLIRPQG